MKYLVLNFTNARLFRNKKTKDFIFEGNMKRPRAGTLMFKEHITVHQISNMLHVLFCERPVPSFREVLYKRNEYIFDKATESYLKYNSEYVEVIQTKKAVYDAFNPISYMNWFRVKKICNDKFKVVVDLISSTLNLNCLEYSFEDVVQMLRSSDPNQLYDYLNSNKLTSITRFIDGSSPTDVNKTKSRLTVVKGVDKVHNLSGEIIVPVSDEDIDKLRKYSTGFATILDGGLVSIVGIKEGYELSVDGFRKVSEISTEKI